MAVITMQQQKARLMRIGERGVTRFALALLCACVDLDSLREAATCPVTADGACVSPDSDAADAGGDGDQDEVLGDGDGDQDEVLGDGDGDQEQLGDGDGDVADAGPCGGIFNPRCT